MAVHDKAHSCVNAASGVTDTITTTITTDDDDRSVIATKQQQTKVETGPKQQRRLGPRYVFFCSFVVLFLFLFFCFSTY